MPTWRRHVVETARLAAPLAVAQLAQMAMALTDTVLVGALGPAALAAGGLGANLFFTCMILLQGVLTSVSVTVAHALGRGAGRVADIYVTGLVLALLLALPAFAVMSVAQPILRALHEPAALAAQVGGYADVLRWGAPGALLSLGLMRAMLPAIGRGRLLLWVALAAVGLNGLLNYGLIHGAWGLPRLGLLGSAAATAATQTGMAVALLAALHLPRSLRRHVAGGRVRLAILGALLRLGWPVAVTYAVETALFLTVGLLVGLGGAAPLAAHQIALSVASSTFMVPLAIGQAANVRVAFWSGARQPAQARRAGFAAIGMGGCVMASTAAVLLLAPQAIVGVFLARDDPANAATLRIAVGLLGIAAVFQLGDGVQTIALGALRGLRDTRAPMLLAALGYWAIGLPVGAALAFGAGLGAAGLWWGLAAGLSSVAALMTWRFAWRGGRPAG
jgi:MATE family multidrug resistance protein